MHEMSLMESVLEIIEDSAARHGCTKVHAVWLEIGQLAGVEMEALRFCFDAVVSNSIAAGARLEIIEIPASGRCPGCGGFVQLNERYDLCPRCDVPVEIVGGMEMRVMELEAE